MAKSSGSPFTPDAPNTVTLSQQALNMLRQIVSAVGWAKSIDQIYLGGKLLAETIPPVDGLEWVKSDEEVRAMNKNQRQAYTERDAKWAATQKTFAISEKEKGAVKLAFEHLSAEGKLGPSQYLTEIIVAFKLVKED